MSELPNGWIETEVGLLPEDWKPVKASIFCDKVADGTHDSPKKSEEGKWRIRLISAQLPIDEHQHPS
ncbi:MAG: hypothetical protein H8D41_05040, partial [bacterium]|nr:hypothetical protein [Candidatus Thioglobus pontius]